MHSLRLPLILAWILLLVAPVAYAGRPQMRPTAARLVELFKGPPKEFQGTEGYVHVSDLYYDGKMGETHSKVKRALSDSEFAKLSWPTRYEGTVQERIREVEHLSSSASEFTGRSGYFRYADLFYKGDMTKALRNVRSVLTKEQFRHLEWPSVYSGSTLEFARDRQNLTGNGREAYLGSDGYMLYAKEFYAGDLMKTKSNISSALTARELSELSWGKAYRGDTIEFHIDKTRLTEQGATDYAGRAGYVRYANEFYDGDMDRAFVQMSAVLSESEKATLDWGSKYLGSSSDFKLDRERLLNNVARYRGQEGYARFAVDFSNGVMSIAFSRMSAVLAESEREQMSWGKAYKGTAAEFLAERQRLTRDYTGREGYIRYAREFYQGDLSVAFSNASAVLSDRERGQLHWGIKFHGNEMELQRIRKFLSKSNGQLDIEKWTGKFTGLTKATDSYMFELGFELPFNETTRKKIRYLIRAAVDDYEVSQLHWDFSSPRGALRSKKSPCESALEPRFILNTF